MSANSKIVGFRIIKIECDVQLEGQNVELAVQVQDRLALRRPVDPSNKSVLLEIETSITGDKGSDFKICLLCEAVFEFKEMPTEIERTLQDECYPIARKHIYDAIKSITQTMGLAPLDLNALTEG